MQTSNNQAREDRQNEIFRMGVGVFMAAAIGFGILELMGVLHV